MAIPEEPESPPGTEGSSSESESDDTSSASTPAPTHVEKKPDGKLVADATSTPTQTEKKGDGKIGTAAASTTTYTEMEALADAGEKKFIEKEEEFFSSHHTSFEFVGGAPSERSGYSVGTDEGLQFAWREVQDKDMYVAIKNAALMENISGDYIEVKCIMCERNVAKPEILRTCVMFYENICHICGLHVSRKWDTFFRKRKDAETFQRDVYGTNFCVSNSMKNPDILYFMELGGNEAVLHGKEKEKTFYQTAYCTDQQKDINWYCWVLHTLCWKESNTRAIVVEFFHFAVIPHLFNIWPEKSRMISYVGSGRHPEMLSNPSWKTYSKVYRILADFVTSDVFFKYPRLSNLFNTTRSNTCLTSGWGTKKNRMYHFPNDERPVGYFSDDQRFR